MGRAPCCDKDKVKKGPWSPEEDAKLKEYIEKYGTGGNWIALPAKIGLKRCGKSCRLRWLNYLRPNIKHGGFTEEEDSIICSLYISIGSRWSIIAAQLPGRTDNDIKNYWNTRLKKKLLGRRRQTSVSGVDQNNGGEQDIAHNLQTMERLQLHMQLHNNINSFSAYNNPNPWQKPKLSQQMKDGDSLENATPNDHCQITPGLTQGEIDDLLDYRSYNLEMQNDCVKEMDRSNESFGWFTGEFDSGSSSFSSQTIRDSDDMYIMGCHF